MSAGRRLIGYLRPYRALFVLGMATTFLASLLDGFTIVILIPLLKRLFGTAGALESQARSTRLEEFVERILEPVLQGTTVGQAAWRIVLILTLGLLLKNAMRYAYSQIVVAMQEGLVCDLRSRLFDHLLKLDIGFFQRTRVGQLVAGIITEVDQTKTAVTATLASFFQNLVMIIISLVVLSNISWQLTVLTLLTAPILIIGVQTLIRRLRRHSRARADERAEITANATERLGAVKLIRAYGREGDEIRRFTNQADSYRKKVLRTQRFSSLTSPVSEMFGGLVLILIIWAGTVPELHGGTTPSPEALIVFLALALRMMSPIKSMSQFPAAMAVALASAERVFALLDTPPAEEEPPGLRMASFEREITFERVSFRYGDDPEVLRDISFTVPKGRVVAMVGPSGAGKTTLVDLLPRFHDPTAGRILLDGVPITAVSRRSLRALIGVVSQETVLLNDTVRANIAYGRPNATAAEVARAAEAANAADFIAALADGYETRLGERGTRLSGGQRQRIAIARALLRDPPILILDEATSALDTESERLVQQAIERLMHERTVLVIAHRLGTIRHADEIIVLDDGRIVGRGSHAELFRQGGLYRRLYEMQFRDEPAVWPVLPVTH